MAKLEIREPRQKRSIEKKQRIIRASYKLFCDKGYYKTNTAEIAQEAGISTGIVYSYFQDKKDILLEVVKSYLASLSEQFLPLFDNPISQDNLSDMIKNLIDIVISSHVMNVEAHNEFMALSLLEKDIYILFHDFEDSILTKLYELLTAGGFSKTNLLEKIRISYGIVEQVSHDSIHNARPQEELDSAKTLAIRIIVMLFHDINE